MTTTRERREARANRLRGWADKRQGAAAAILQRSEQYRGDHAFNTQPGHIPERARLVRAEDKAHESLAVARDMDSRAAGIESQLSSSIYSDDSDAAERLQSKIATLSAKRDAMKAKNAAFRKIARAALAALPSVYARDCAMPHRGYELANIGGTIRAAEKRLKSLTIAQTRRAAGLPESFSRATFSSRCGHCRETIELGAPIGRFDGEWRHLTEEYAPHPDCISPTEQRVADRVEGGAA